MSQTKVYAIRNRHGSYLPRARYAPHWTRDLAAANLFTKLAHARTERTRLQSPDLNGAHPRRRLTIVEITVSNPRPVPDRTR